MLILAGPTVAELGVFFTLTVHELRTIIFVSSIPSKLTFAIYAISVLFCYAFMHVCLLLPFGHLLGKG